MNMQCFDDLNIFFTSLLMTLLSAMKKKKSPFFNYLPELK